MTDRLNWTRTDIGFRAEFDQGYATLHYTTEGAAPHWTWIVTCGEAVESGIAQDRQAASDRANEAVPKTLKRAEKIEAAAVLDREWRERIDELAWGMVLLPDDVDFEDKPTELLNRIMWLATNKWAPSGKRSPVPMPVLEVFLGVLSAEFARRRGIGAKDG